MLTAFFAPYLKVLFNLKFVDGNTKITSEMLYGVQWNAGEYHFSYLFYFGIIDLAQDRGRWRVLLNAAMNLWVP